jgi:hypothetical protein
VREDARQRAAEFVKELYAAGAIDADRLDTSVDGVLAARSETELAGVIRSAWTSLRPSSMITSSTCTFTPGGAASRSSCPRAWAYR